MANTNFNGLAGRYHAALWDYLAHSPPENLRAALELGQEALSLGMETLDPVRTHEGALREMLDAAVPAAPDARATQFFTEALAPLEASRAAALAAGSALAKINAALALNTAELAASARALDQGVSERLAAERGLEHSKFESARLLTEAQQLQQYLQEQTRRILTSHEEQRRKMSLTLQDEIVQTLLGIQVRLLALQKEVSVSTDGFQKEIAATHRLAEKSGQTIKRFVREYGVSHES